MAAMTQREYQIRTLNRLGKWLTDHGYTWRLRTLYSPHSERLVIRVDTDYIGLYPVKEVLAAHEAIRTHVQRMRCNTLHVESHPMKISLDICF